MLLDSGMCFMHFCFELFMIVESQKYFKCPPGERQATELSSADETSSRIGSWGAPQDEIDRRRNFAIISHPDAGKTTLTEKLLLYGGAIQEVQMLRGLHDDWAWSFVILGQA